MRAITCARARVFGGINFGDLVKNSPIRQIKIPAKVSGYAVVVYTTEEDHRSVVKTFGANKSSIVNLGASVKHN